MKIRANKEITSFVSPRKPVRLPQSKALEPKIKIETNLQSAMGSSISLADSHYPASALESAKSVKFEADDDLKKLNQKPKITDQKNQRIARADSIKSEADE